MKELEIIQVIVTNLFRRGDGKTDPIRIVTQYWDMQGNLIFEFDPCGVIATLPEEKPDKPTESPVNQSKEEMKVEKPAHPWRKNYPKDPSPSDAIKREEAKRKAREYAREYYRRTHNVSPDENRENTKPRSIVAKSGNSYCQNPFCLNHENKVAMPKSEMVKQGGLFFCSKDCAADYENEK